MSVRRTLDLLEQYELKAKKKYGQNFLVDENLIKKITDTVEAGENVIEVGPGLGALTGPLLEKAGKMTAYEIDSDLVEILKQQFPDEKLELINEDFLKAELPEGKSVLVSNLPYYVTGDILLKCFREKDKLNRMTVMMQKEVADKFFADGYQYGILNVLADMYSDYRIVCRADRHCFIPAPNVDSTVMEFVFNDKPFDEDFCRFLESCFRQRRKMLSGNLKKAGYQLIRDIGKVRAEELSVQELYRLYEEVK